jgi:2-keto-4-pentenoate hydratase/2-oxohepta-3-ene-1,7-dioic acid hydratase in catechol pathway
MKFVTFQSADGSAATGVLHGERVFPLSPQTFPDALAVIQAGEKASEAARLATQGGEGRRLSEVRLLAPLLAPPRIFCIGLNYASHASESQMQVQAVPTVFMKLSESVVGPGADVVLPNNSSQPDYEAELAVVIGTPGYRIAASAAEEHIFGYTILNDVSARDIQLATSQWTLGKSFPSFTPLGPALVTRDEIPDPHALAISLEIDGETLQHSNTRHLIFRIPQLIEYISSCTPLKAGDIISTGTPEGVGLGRKPQRWLKPGEEMVVRIEGLGELRNKTVAEAGA